jgi:hypothetical protein
LLNLDDLLARNPIRFRAKVRASGASATNVMNRSITMKIP